MWNTETRYGLISRTLHWSIALLFFANFLLGILGEELAEENEALEQTLLNTHSTLGILLLLLVVIRVVLGRFQVTPQPPATMPAYEIKLAQLMKTLLNLLIILIAVSGIVSLNTKGEAAVFFSWSLPLLFAESHDLHEAAEEVHELSAFLLMGLVGLHAAAALKHHFIDRDEILKRMLGK